MIIFTARIPKRRLLAGASAALCCVFAVLAFALTLGGRAVAASAAWLLFRDGSTPSPTARITRDGVLLEEINLNQVDAPRSFVLEDESGSNTVAVEKGRIRVS